MDFASNVTSVTTRRRPQVGDNNPAPDGGYPSARDLPTFAEFDEKLKAMKLLALAQPKMRPTIRELEKSLRALTDSVDGFYRLLQGRDWVYHDQLNVEVMRGPIEADDADALEATLIAFYSDSDQLNRLVNQLAFQPNMPERIHLVRLAREDHLAGRYYATTLTLLAVMDGFVNEIEKARRGLSSRDADEINPWNSAVGHHMGLKAAHRSFTKTFKATSTDDVTTLHRNGIVHGNLPNFNNPLVASKAWNRLMAVNDWARSLEAARQPPPTPMPPIKESLKQIAATTQRVARLREWTGRKVHADSADFATEPVAIAANALFGAWESQNFGQLAVLLREAPKKSEMPRFIGDVRRRFEGASLDEFRVERIDMLTSSVAVVTATLIVEGREFLNETRWFREDEARHSVPEFEGGGTWRCVHYWPDEFGATPNASI